MRVINLLSIAAIAVGISACSNSATTTSSNEGTCADTCTTHNHEHNHGHAHGDACEGHNHEMVVVGVAQQGDYKSGKITINTLSGERKDFNYKESNQDKIAAWQAGDTVSIIIDHHHHGDKAHDSIVAIKIGEVKTAAHAHENCEGEGHEHHDHDHGHNH